jgi:hypothetical protein
MWWNRIKEEDDLHDSCTKTDVTVLKIKCEWLEDGKYFGEMYTEGKCCYWIHITCWGERELNQKLSR